MTPPTATPRRPARRQTRSDDPTVRRELAAVAERLRAARARRGLSTRALSALARLSTNTVHAIERGRTSRMELCTVLSLADALGVPRAWLAFGDGQNPL